MLKLETGELALFFDGLFVYCFNPSTNMHLKRKPSKKERERIIKVKDKNELMDKSPELDVEFGEEYDRVHKEERTMQIRHDQL